MPCEADDSGTRSLLFILFVDCANLTNNSMIQKLIMHFAVYEEYNLSEEESRRVGT